MSSAPEEDSPGSGSPRSIAHSDEPSSVFASTAATPTDPGRALPDELNESCDESTASAVVSELTMHEEDKDKEERKTKDSPASSRDARSEGVRVRETVAPLAEGEDIADDEERVCPVPLPIVSETRPVSESDAHISVAHRVRGELTSVSESSIVRRDRSGERKRNDICPWEDE